MSDRVLTQLSGGAWVAFPTLEAFHKAVEEGRGAMGAAGAGGAAQASDSEPLLEAEGVQHVDGAATGKAIDEHPAVIEFANRERRRLILVCRAASDPPPRSGPLHLLKSINDGSGAHRDPRASEKDPHCAPPSWATTERNGESRRAMRLRARSG